MSFIADEILKVIKEFNLDVAFINKEEYKDFFNRAISTFMNNNSSYPLWSSIFDKISVRDADAWRFIPHFVGNNTILFLEKGDADFAIIFKQSNHLKVLLENSFQFGFYLTNASFDYLLCFNDHDYLIGSGEAKKWIESMINNS